MCTEVSPTSDGNASKISEHGTSGIGFMSWEVGGAVGRAVVASFRQQVTEVCFSWIGGSAKIFKMP